MGFEPACLGGRGFYLPRASAKPWCGESFRAPNNCAAGRDRTDTPKWAADFKSTVYTNSTTAAQFVRGSYALFPPRAHWSLSRSIDLQLTFVRPVSALVTLGPVSWLPTMESADIKPKPRQDLHPQVPILISISAAIRQIFLSEQGARRKLQP